MLGGGFAMLFFSQYLVDIIYIHDFICMVSISTRIVAKIYQGDQLPAFVRIEFHIFAVISLIPDFQGSNPPLHIFSLKNLLPIFHFPAKMSNFQSFFFSENSFEFS